MGTNFKLSSSAAKVLKAAKSLPATIVIKLGAPGFSQKTITTSATLVVK